jgi:hypothetical protein
METYFPSMTTILSRRNFLVTAIAAVPLGAMGTQVAPAPAGGQPPSGPSPSDRIVDIHVHFDEKIPTFLDDFLRISDKLNLTACMLTPFAHRKVVADAARKHPTKIVPFGFVELDAPDAAQQVKELHDLGYRGLGELEFPRKPFVDRSYDPVYELANDYSWIVLFHTGTVTTSEERLTDASSTPMRSITPQRAMERYEGASHVIALDPWRASSCEPFHRDDDKVEARQEILIAMAKDVWRTETLLVESGG